MVFQNFNGASFWLIDDPQDASDAFQTTVSVFRDSTAGLTNRETRRPFSELFRWQCQFQLTLEGTARITFETALAADPGALHAVPLWPLAIPAADFALSEFTAGVWVAIDPPAAAQLFTTAPPAGLSAAAVVMPVALGIIAKRQTEAIGPDVARAVIDFTEASLATWAISPKAFAMVNGPLPSAQYPVPPKLCDFFLDFEKLADAWTFKAYTQQIGFGRETQRETYPQTPAREFRGEFVLPTLTEAARFLSFVRVHFAGQTFWTPTWKLAALVSGPVAAGQTVFTGPNNLAPGAAVAFVTLYSVDARKVTTADANGFSIDAGVGPFEPDQFGVHDLKLVRIRTTEQNINWIGNGVSRAALDFREVPAEYTIPADEILGGTIGALPLRVFLYDLETHLSGPIVNRGRYTSFEKDLDAPGGTYLAQQINHAEIRQSTNLDRNEIDLEANNFPGNPLIDLAALRLYAPLFLTVQQATLAGGTVSNLEVVFFGEITESDTTGETIKARAVTGGTLFDRLLPRFTAQPTCNYALFSPGCTLPKADWKFSANVSAPGTAGFPFVFTLSGLARVTGTQPTFTADYFAGGWIEFGTGAGLEIIPVLRSTMPAVGTLDVTLSRDPRPFPVGGAAVVLYPGCDARRETCIGKFNNYLNFGGHPFIPKANSTVVRPEPSQNVGKK